MSFFPFWFWDHTQQYLLLSLCSELWDHAWPIWVVQGNLWSIGVHHVEDKHPKMVPLLGLISYIFVGYFLELILALRTEITFGFWQAWDHVGCQGLEPGSMIFHPYGIPQSSCREGGAS